MNVPQRPAVQVALVPYFVFFLIMLVAPQTIPAQQHAAAKQSVPTALQSHTPPLYSSSNNGGGGGDDDEKVVVTTNLVPLTLTVTDKDGVSVKGLGKDAFTVFDNKVAQEIVYFSDADAPASIGVVFDLSGSMGGEKLARAREALDHFMQTGHEKDEYFLIGFNSRVQLLVDQTSNADAVIDKLRLAETAGSTSLYDAVYLGIEKVMRGTHSKRVLLVISDGDDNNSRYSFKELRHLLKESDVLIYGIGILSEDERGSVGIGGQLVLDNLASCTGGKSFFPDGVDEMNETFERIALELRHQYSIGFRPTNFVSDGKWHKIKVKVQTPRGLPRLRVSNKEGYYAVTTSR